MTRATLRKGFTLAEMLVVVVLIGIIGAALTRVLIFQTRHYDQQHARRSARAVSRNAMNVIMSELRMVQDSLGVDSLGIDGKGIRVRVPYWFGMSCGGDAAFITVSMLPSDSAMVNMAEYAGYAYRNPATGTYTYVQPPLPLSVNLPTISTAPSICTQVARIAGVRERGRDGNVLTLTPGDAAVTPTTPVFLWQRVTYVFAPSMEFAGRFGLYRQVGSQRAEEIMGPFDATARFRVYFTGDDTSRTVYTHADTALVRGVDIVLSGMSQSTPGGLSGPVQSRMASAIFFKNVRRN